MSAESKNNIIIMASSTSTAPGFIKIEPKEEQMEEIDVGEKEEQLNRTDGDGQLQQQQNSETHEAAMKHDNNNDDDEMPFDGSFICICYVVECIFVISCIFCACSSVKGQTSAL